MRTSRRLIDALLIKGRFIDYQGKPVTGFIRADIPGYARNRTYVTRLDGRFKIKIPGYHAFQKITLFLQSGFFTSVIYVHPRSWVMVKGQFDGYKVIDLKDIVLRGGI